MDKIEILKSAQWQVKKAKECEQAEEWGFAWYHWDEVWKRLRYILPPKHVLLQKAEERSDRAFAYSRQRKKNAKG
jgi:hypothetical protein